MHIDYFQQPLAISGLFFALEWVPCLLEKGG